MPHLWIDNTNKVAVEVSELVPKFWSNQNVLSKEISRNRERCFGVKPLQRGCRNRRLLIDFDTLPNHVQQELGDPRKVEHNLLYFYKTSSIAVDFYTNFKRPDGFHLTSDEQQRYITNASVLISVVSLREKHIVERIKTGISLKGINTYLSNECNSFNDYLEKKELPKHNLPTHPT